ncbi:SPOR domain-containing protein [candidate division WOR-3 bacterium]|nr:SPOR domain-containing protein [candidate division WOR-3 bacterium]
MGLYVPDQANPWAVQLLSLTDTDNIYENTVEINTVLEEESFLGTGSYARFAIVQGIFQDRRVYRICAGAFPSRDEATEAVNALTSKGVDCFPKNLFVEEKWEFVVSKTGEIFLGSDHVVDILDNGQISTDRERAYVQPQRKYAALAYSNWTGFEGEGENLYLLNLESLNEKLVLIDMRAVLPYFWFSDDNDGCFLITELLCGGTAYSNEVIIVNCETAGIVARYEHCTVDRCCEEESFLYLDSLSPDETVEAEIKIDLKDFFNSGH